ncbi:MAG: chromosomal replication initiator protein DnaA [Thermoflexales bacterium]|nr:chromosomal replication initiator protein DnaA [Thermoflexales bacterium]
MKPSQAWQTALGQLQMQMPRATFDTWVRQATVLSYEDGMFVIGVHNGYAKDWLENRLHPLIQRTLTNIVGQSVQVRFVVWSKTTSQDDNSNPLLNLRPETEEALDQGEERIVDEPAVTPGINGINGRYTFETFVVGPSNRLAQAAALAVTENHATAYNPLFLYGGVGLGKTHLLHAVGVESQRRGRQTLYVSSEQFTNELVNAIRTQTTAAFRDKYRSIDVLLIDDIQFIAGKEATQEEFFHTFNALHDNGKQIVISSDRPPKALVTLEERLRSRCEWGLIADIQPPDLETRMAILQAKAESLSMDVPDEVIGLIAHLVQSNIRELEGALNRVIAYTRLMRAPLDKGAAEAALAELVARPASISMDNVLQIVAEYYNIDLDAIQSKARNKEIVRPRHVIMYLAREEAGVSLPDIGTQLGGRDHTTVMYGVEKIAQEIEHDDSLRRDILTIRDRLYRLDVARQAA